jgi:hypothetical protein
MQRAHSTENAFLDEIDCRLPYGDPARCKALVDRGIAISPNAAFAVLHEICRPPRSAQASESLLMQLLDYWRSRFAHPAAFMLGEVAAAMILKRELSVDDVTERIRTLARYPRLYAALAILCSACDDAEARLEPTVTAIRQRWGALPDM